MTRRHAIAGVATGLIFAERIAAAVPGEPSLSLRIGEAVVAAREAAVPEAVAERTAWTLLDAMGAIVHGARLPSTRPVVAMFAARKGTPEAMIYGRRMRAPVELAAAANAFLIHADEVDDSDLRAQLRASAVILPTALALAEATDCSGARFVHAAALGYTLQGRLAAPLGPIQRFGWMASGVWGPPAAAAMASSMLGSSAAAIADAIGLAGSASGGSFQYFYDQTEEKRLIVARAARIAVESAQLAKVGEAGPRRILEGQAGLYRLFGGAEAALPDATTLTGRLGDLEGPLYVRPKYYAASHSIIPMLDGMALDLPADVRAEDVTAFVVRGDAGWARVLGDKIDHFVAPASQIGGMINFSFVVATWLRRRNALPRDFEPGALNDPVTLALAARGRFEIVGGVPLSLELIMRDGRRLTARARTPGPGERAPPEREQRSAKFDALTAPLSPDRRAALRRACLDIGRAASMRRWATDTAAIIGDLA